jgi:ABC-2 type transport system permease protein
MRETWIIAWHGFVQHATSRPFLLGVMLPLFYLLLVGWVPSASQSQLALLGAPIRHFAVVDETGRMVPAIDAAILRERLERGMLALNAYAKEHADEEKLRAGDAALATLVLDADPVSKASARALEAKGGTIAAFIALRPYLKPGAPAFNEPSDQFFRIDLPEDLVGAKDLAKAAQPYLSAERLTRGPFGPVHLWAILVVPQGVLDGSQSAIYLADDLNRPGLREFLRAAVDLELRRLAAADLSIPAEGTERIIGTASQIRSVDPDPEKLGAVTGVRQLQVLAANLVYFMLFFALFMTANMVVMALVEEKSNRVAELLLSCVRAETLMAGKLLTGLLLALFLVVVWVVTVSAAIAVFFPAGQVIASELLANISSPAQIFQITVFFAMSYLTVGAFFLAAGSAANSISDAQAVVAPATLVTMPICMLPLAVAYAPESAFARFASYVPFFAPFTMMVRSLSSPEGIDILGSFIVSALTLWWLIRLVARVFRANLLRPDAPASFSGFLRDLLSPPRRI